MDKAQKPKRVISVLGDASQGLSRDELVKKIARLDGLLSKLKSRMAMRHKEWLQEIEKMPPKEKALLLKGLSFYNLDSKGSES